MSQSPPPKAPGDVLNCMNPSCDFQARVNADGKIPRLMMCSGCKKVSYCSKECQRAHWPRHRGDCKKLGKAKNMPTVEQFGTQQIEFDTPLFGNHAPASERIRWHSTTDTKDKLTREKFVPFFKKLDMEHVIQYAVEKFINTGKGAVVFHLDRPVAQFADSGRFLWAPHHLLAKTGDSLLSLNTRNYNPVTSIVVLFLLPSADGLSVDVWSIEPLFTLPPSVAQQARESLEDWDEMIMDQEKKGRKK